MARVQRLEEPRRQTGCQEAQQAALAGLADHDAKAVRVGKKPGSCSSEPQIPGIARAAGPSSWLPSGRPICYGLREESAVAPDASLEFVVAGRALFTSAGKWLHPLFELERFLADRGIDGGSGEIRDKVVGRGSAFLIVRLGVRKVHAGLLSRLGKDVLDRALVACTWDTFVDEIACSTESILRGVTDPDEAYRILSERARKAREARGAE
jgi:hypothetical protein